MIGTSTFDYIHIRFWILFLHHLTPASVVYCAYLVACVGLQAPRLPVPAVLEAVAITECLFYLAVFLPYRAYLRRCAIAHPPLSRARRRELFWRCNGHIADPAAYFQKWFLDAHPQEIRRDNVKEFFLWAFFGRDGPPGDDDAELEEYVAATEQLLGREIRPGRGSARSLRLTIDGVDMLHRSILWYMCIWIVELITFIRLSIYGFRFYRTGLGQFFLSFPFRTQSLLTPYQSPAKHTTYWYRPHTSKTQLPVLFIHGIGIGLYPYVDFLREINSTAAASKDPDEQIGVLAIEILAVSARMTPPTLPRDEMCAEIGTILQTHFPAAQRFVVVSHSYGTVVTTHLLHSPLLKARIASVVLMDPVSLLLHLPDVAHNFTRRVPRRANEHQIQYFASRDPAISHTLARCFFWDQNILWKEDLRGTRATVCLNARDNIVNALAVGRYLAAPADQHGPDVVNPRTPTPPVEEWMVRPWRGAGLDIIWFRELDHAQAFDTAPRRAAPLAVIHAYCRA